MTDVFDRLKEALSDRYAIEREIGSGGMATVYLAEDTKHHRKVAVKVLRPELAESLGAERFLREVEVTAQLNHPHILPLLDSGQANGFLFYVMPYVEGETLRERIAREGQLPIDDALQITRQAAAALAYAHSHGVIHRDIKPENVLLSAGEAVVADFGISRAVSSAGSERLTETGLAVGTPAYMSPEQAAGETEVDARSDQYSLGCVLYEMLAGDAPFSASTPQALIAKKLAEPTPHISVVRETVPAAVEAAVTKALAKTPADRFITAQQFAEALATPKEWATPVQTAVVPAERGGKWPTWYRVAGLTSAAVVVVVGVLLVRGGFRGVDSLVGDDVIDRLVVAPFENRTGDPEAADWAFMAADFITRGIDRASVVTVVPAHAVRDLVREVDPTVGMPLAEIARRTAAQYAVAGSYTVSAGQLRFDVELVDAVTGEMLRALDPVAGPADSLETVVSLLAERVTAATMALLNPDLGPEFAQWSSPPSLEVFRGLMAVQDLFCRSRYQDAIDEAQPVLQEAPNFAPLLLLSLISYSNLGRTSDADSLYGLIEPLMEQLTTGERLLAEWMHGNLYGDHAEATRAVEQLFRIEPGNYGYHAGLTALRTNRLDDALERLLAQDINTPCYRRWWQWWSVTGTVYHMLGRYDEELDVIRSGLERFPNQRRLIFREAIALAGLGRLDAVDSLIDVIDGLPAQPRDNPGQRIAFIAMELKVLGHLEAYGAVMDRALDWFAARPMSQQRAWRGQAFYYAERWSDADTLFANLIEETPDNLDYRGYRAVTLAHLGRREEALEADRWLQSNVRPYSRGSQTRWRAAIAAALGDHAGAVQLLEQAIQEGMQLGYIQHRDPEWETLRDYGPYQMLMRPERVAR